VRALPVTEFEQWKQYVNYKKRQGNREISKADGAMLVKTVEG